MEPFNTEADCNVKLKQPAKQPAASWGRMSARASGKLWSREAMDPMSWFTTGSSCKFEITLCFLPKKCTSAFVHLQPAKPQQVSPLLYGPFDF